MLKCSRLNVAGFQGLRSAKLTCTESGKSYTLRLYEGRNSSKLLWEPLKWENKIQSLLAWLSVPSLDIFRQITFHKIAWPSFDFPSGGGCVGGSTDYKGTSEKCKELSLTESMKVSCEVVPVSSAGHRRADPPFMGIEEFIPLLVRILYACSCVYLFYPLL